VNKEQIENWNEHKQIGSWNANGTQRNTEKSNPIHELTA